MLCVSVKMGFAQVNHSFHNSETYVETVLDAATLQTLSQEFSIDRVQRNSDGSFNTRIWLSYKDYDNFLAREIPYTVEQPTRVSVTMATNYAEMVNGWNRYPTYSTYLAMMDTFQTRYPNLCKIDTILAATPGGRKVLCAHISNNLNDNQGKPSIFYTSTMHGDEVVGYYFMLRLIDMLLTNYNSNTRLTNMVNNFDIWICPLHNPDGTYHTSDNQINTSPTSTRANAHSVDLNRSFPQQGQTIGSNYEPEVSAMMQFLGAHNFTLAANFHGGAEVFNYPWDAWTTSTHAHADDAWWQYVGRKFADTCQAYNSNYFTEENDGITEGGDWYVITGSMQDYHNWFLGTRHVTIEVGDKVLPTSSLPNYWGYAYHSLLNFIEEADNGIHGTVTDSQTGEPLLATVYVNNHDADHSYVETTLPYGAYHRPIKAGTYSVTYSAEGYNSKTITVNVSDGAKLVKNVQLVSLDTNSCKMPKYVTVNYDGGTSAVVSWTSTAQSCNIMLNNTQISNVTSPYTLTDLTSSTHYDVQVQANCGGGDLSDWTDAVGFTTDCLAQDRCELTFVLTDSWGDSWNGAAINVVDAATGEILGSLANENLNGTTGNGENEVNTKTLAVCNGRNINFVWVSGTYDSECSYIIYNAFGDVILSGSGALATTNHTVDCGLSACARPTGLAVMETTGSTATLGWTENGEASSWQICLNGDETNLINVTANPYTLTELTAETAYTAKVRANCGEEQSAWSNEVSFVPSNKIVIGTGTSTSTYLPTHNYYKYTLTQQIYTTAELGAAGNIVSIDFYKNSTVECNRNLDIYMISTDKSSFESNTDWITVSDNDKVFSGTVSFANNDWTTITFSTPFSYDGTRNVAIVVDDNTGSYKNNTQFLTFTAASNQSIYYYNDNTNSNPTANPSSANGRTSSKNQIRLLKEAAPTCLAPTALAVVELDHQSATLTWTENGEATSWKVACLSPDPNEITVSDSSYTFTDLEPETTYMVQVAAICGDELVWSDTILFTTLSVPCSAPTDVTVSSVSFHSAVVSWTENGEATSWKVACLSPDPNEITVSDSSYTFTDLEPETTYMVQVAAICGDELVWSDTILFTTLSVPCSAPTDVTVSSVSRHSAVVSWTENGEATSWVFAYKLSSEQTFVEVEVSENTYMLAGLAIGTDYIVKVRPVCESGDENWSDQKSFTTESCSAILLDEQNNYEWKENFDSYTNSTVNETGVQPDCWEVVARDVALNASTMPQVYRGFATSGSYSLRMKNRCVYAMPELDEDIAIDQLTMTFNLRQPNSLYRLQVGVVNENGVFTVVKTINNASTGKESVTVDFAEYTGDGHRIAFRNTLGKGSTLSYSYNYIDDIVLSYSTVTTCGIDVLPYSEQFEGYTNTTATETGVQPDCWEVITEDVALSESTKPQLYRGYSTSGDYTLRLKNRCVYAMPEFTTDVSVSDLTMTFNLRQPNSNYRLQVGVLETDGSFTALKTLKSGTSMQSKTVNFSGYTGTGNRIAFRNTLIPGTGMSTDYLDYSINYIDDINLFRTTGKSMEVTAADAGMMGAGRDMLDVMVYPNPTKEFVNVQCTMYNVQCSGIEVVDVYGKVVRTDVGANNDSATQINVSGLAAGMYFVRVTTDKGVVTKPFVKK